MKILYAAVAFQSFIISLVIRLIPCDLVKEQRGRFSRAPCLLLCGLQWVFILTMLSRHIGRTVA